MKQVAFATFASNYARAVVNSRVRVTFSGKTAFARKGCINLPAFPAGTTLTPKQVRIFTGYLDHEIGHHLYSDLPYLEKEMNKGAPKRVNHIRSTLINIFEDIRIENLLIRDTPGTKELLDVLTEELEMERVIEEQKQENHTATKAELVMSGIYRLAYETYRNAKIAFPGRPDITKDPALANIVETMKELAVVKNEQEVVDLAQKVCDLLPQADYEKEVETEERGDEDPILVILGSGTGSGGQTIEALNALEEAAEAMLEESERSKAIKAIVIQVKEDNQIEGEADKDEKEKSKERKRNSFRRQGNSVLPPVATDHDKVFVPSSEDLPRYQKTLASVSAEISAMKRMLQLFLMSKKKKSWLRGQEEGRLDDDRLVDLMLGDRNVFKEKRETTFINTAVQMMVDCSGSMNDENTRVAAIALSEAINSVNEAKLAIAGFTTNHHSYCGWDRGGKYKGLGRSCGLDILLFKKFDEPLAQAKGRIGAIRSTGYTPLGEAYGHGLAAVLERKEHKKILWIVTDGEPCLDLADNDHDEYLLMERVYKKAKRHGVMVILLGIGSLSKEVRDCCDVSKTIRDASELPQVVLELTKEVVV